MNFRTYQEQALKTDQIPHTEKIDTQIIVPMLGLAGEAGELLSEYKKYLRDGDARKLFPEHIKEELGDLLWYIANLASKFELDLDDIAQSNLQKCQDRWGIPQKNEQMRRGNWENCFDSNFPEKERLARQFEVEFTEVSQANSIKMKAFRNGKQIGDELTDNSRENDGYRFHDVFHLSYAAVLGWSPVTRKLLDCKRKSDLLVDEVEDGGRAIAIEEGLSALVFSYAKDLNFLEGVSELDYQLLKTIKSMTYHLEVSQCSLRHWKEAIFRGYEVWRELKNNKGGKVIVDIDTSSITYQKRE